MKQIGPLVIGAIIAILVALIVALAASGGLQYPTEQAPTCVTENCAEQ